MDAQKLQLKIFVTPESARAIELEMFIPVFHRWIKERLLPELVIDVANYVHVPEGPGVVLIGHGSDYFMDLGEGRMGLLHNRKRAGPSPADRLADLARRTLHAALLLERDPMLSGKLRFATNEFVFRINDRLLAPNSDSLFVSLKPELDGLAARLFAGPYELTRTGGAKDLFSVRLAAPAGPSLATMLERF
jgi:hypothetical protein